MWQANYGNDPYVSIHAPVRGATVIEETRTREETCFNPRAREGRDELDGELDIQHECFNPRAREGRDKL